MRRLWPEPALDIEAFDLYADAPPDVLRIGMVTSLDGSATDAQGWTDELGGAADFRVFRALRAHADGIMMGAATLRSGRVGPHRMAPGLRAARAAAGRPAPAAIIVVSRSLDLDWSHRVFTEATVPTLVLTCAGAVAADRVPDGLRDRVIVTGHDDVDLTAGLAELRDRQAIRHVLCEGGPRLAGSLLAAGLVDELCLSVAPTLVGDAARTRLIAGLPGQVPAALAGVAVDEGVTFLRYRTRVNARERSG